MPAITKPTVPTISETEVRAIVEEHKIVSDAHHTWPLTDANIPAAIARDTEVTADIATHTSDADAHHAKYTDAEATAQADAKITAECVGGQTIDNAIDALVATHATDADAHHTWPLTDANIPAAIARDTEVTADIATHTSDADAHHTWPLTDAEIPDTHSHTAGITGSFGGVAKVVRSFSTTGGIVTGWPNTSSGWSGTFTNGDGATVTVSGGIITGVA